MNFIFPMGGLSSRFTKAGYTVPKFLLDVHGSTVFERAIIGFDRFFADHNFIFAFRGGVEIRDFVKEKCLKMGIPPINLKLVELAQVTSGQAETVRIAIEQAGVANDETIVIFNIDTFQAKYNLPVDFNIDEVDGYLEVFIAEGDHWSFVAPGDGNKVLKVTEKVRISEYCSSGLYHFRRAGDFCRAFDNTLSTPSKDLQGGERYIAPLYNDLISAGADIRFQLVPFSNLTLCGTPAEYTALISLGGVKGQQ